MWRPPPLPDNHNPKTEKKESGRAAAVLEYVEMFRVRFFCSPFAKQPVQCAHCFLNSRCGHPVPLWVLVPKDGGWADYSCLGRPAPRVGGGWSVSVSFVALLTLWSDSRGVDMCPAAEQPDSAAEAGENEDIRLVH